VSSEPVSSSICSFSTSPPSLFSPLPPLILGVYAHSAELFTLTHSRKKQRWARVWS
jgi:hypothetical protein